MPPLFPPEYPHRPDAPLLSFGPSFSEEIARSVIDTIWHEPNKPQEDAVRVAAALTMLEAFHPRDHLECMMAAQGVATHTAMMECLRQAALADTPQLVAIKLRANATQLGRAFSLLVKDLERRQSKALPKRPDGTEPPADPPPDSPPPKRKRTQKAETAVPPPPIEHPTFDDIPDLPEDIETRPDGTPGSLTAYATKPYVENVVIPRVAPIMAALAMLPKPWRMVDTSEVPGELPPEPTPPAPVPSGPPPPETVAMRGPLDLRDKIFSGDALSRFASTRFDPDAPIPPINLDDEDSVVELELISTGGDPELEAERAAMKAAHPEGKPILTLRYGTKEPPDTG